MEQIKVKRFRMKNLHFPCNILMIGPSGSRKSATIRRILNEPQLKLHNDDEIVVVSSNPEQYTEEDFKECPAQIKIYGKDADQKTVKDDLTSKALACRVFENIRVPSFSVFDNSNGDIRCCIQALDNYKTRVLPQSEVAQVDYVILFGGITDSAAMRRIWDDFGFVLPRVKDFKQIYLACTDEGDRYCDDFMIIKTSFEGGEPPEDLQGVFFWSSLQREPVKDIAVNVELVLNRVHVAEEVQLPAVSAQDVIVGDAQEEASRRAAEQEGGGADSDGGEDANRDPRECIIL